MDSNTNVDADTNASGEEGKDGAGSDIQQTEVSFPINSCTRKGLIELFREAEECEEGFERNFFPENVEDSWREIYERIGQIEGVTLTVEYESD